MARTRLPDFKAGAAAEARALGSDGAARLLDAGRAWDLAPALRAGGAVVFPHIGLGACGHMVGAAVHACFESGAERVVALGVLHAHTQELEDARSRVAAGGDAAMEPARGIQGPGLPGRQDWVDEFSLLGFLFLWEEEARRRGGRGPELLARYPYLAGGRPESMPGMAALAALARGAVIVATADPFHHGIGYGDRPEDALAPEGGGLALARRRIEEGLGLLRCGDYWGYNQHCVRAKSDARDVGQVLRLLAGPAEWRIHEIAWSDMTAAYGAPAPTWVAGALIELFPARMGGTA